MRLVAAVDLQDKGEAVLSAAVPWARRFHGKLDLVFASEWSTEGLPTPTMRSDELDALWASWELRAEEERRGLARLLETLPSDIRGQARLISGRPADAIPDAIRSYDLLVVATHRRQGASRMLLGSVVHRLIREVQTPTLIVGIDDPVPEPSGRLLVLAPVEERGPGALRWIAQHLGAERVEVVHAMEALTPQGGWLPSALRVEGASMSLEPVMHKMSLEAQIHHETKAHGFPAAPVHLSNRDTQNPGDTVARLANELGADVIVMPTHGRKGLQRWFVGSVAERVMERAPCAVLVVPAALLE